MKTRQLLFILFALILVTAYSGWFLRGIGYYRMAREMADWSYTTGTVVHSVVRYSNDLIPRHSPDLITQYTVGGELYENLYPWAGSSVPQFPLLVKTGFQLIDGRDVAGHLASYYPEGAEVTLYYDPIQPEESIIERDIPPRIKRNLAIYIGLLVIELYLLIVGILKFMGIIKLSEQ